MATVSIHMPEQSGQSGLSLYLRKTSDGTLVNTGGDSLTESPASSGRFTATVAETWAETLAASVQNASSLIVRDGWLAEGETIVRDAYPSSGGGGSVTVDADAVVNALLAQGPTLYTALTADETILRIADEYVQEFAGLGDLSGRDNIAFALKTRKTDADTAALIYLTEDGGLTRVNGAAYVTTANGSITVDDEVAGDITVRISSAVTAGLTVGKRQDAVKILITGGNDITKRQGLTNVIDGTVAALG